jgi:hypothetical protein
VVFDGHAPNLASIANKVSELTGLPVSITAPDPKPWASQGVEDLGCLAFACVPDEKLMVGVLRNIAAERANDQTSEPADGAVAKLTDRVPGGMSWEEIGLIFSGQESTLYNVTMLALGAMGGQLPYYWPSEKVGRKYGEPITARLLDKRRRNARRWAVLESLIYALVRPVFFLVLIVLIPIVFLGYVLTKPLSWLFGRDTRSS